MSDSINAALIDTIDRKAAGRGQDGGWVKCPLCAQRSQKRFARGKGFHMHLESIHAPSKEKHSTPAEYAEWPHIRREAIATARVVVGKGFTRDGKVASAYRQSLPPLLAAARDGDVAALQRIVAAAGARVLSETRDRNNSLAEHWAAGNGHLDALKWILANKLAQPPRAKKAAVRRRDGRSVLHWAARNGQLHIVEYLVSERATLIDCVTGDLTTPLHLACFGAHLAVARRLVAAGADVMRCNAWGCGSEHFAAMSTARDDAAIVDVLRWLHVECGLTLQRVQKEGHTTLHKAALKGKRAVMQFLLSTLGVEWHGVDDKIKAIAKGIGGLDGESSDAL